ncbi:hypothetical protein [Halorussus marinus]|uniref:hypothetical protein n=1 Tax=Halorussus marinus TaxID=2505976 RepID=UPI0010929BA5|nr:hypothetical protein [Halorussus marinus]
MAEPGWPRHALDVGLFEFRRSVRAIWADKARFALMSLGVVIPSASLGAFVVVFADAIRGVDALALPAQLRGTVALFWLFGVFVVGQRVASARTRVDAEPLMLTTVSARTIAAGLAIAETLRIFAYLGLPVLVATGAAVYLFESVASLVAVPAAALLFTATAVVVGSTAGYAVALLVATSRFVARHKTVLGSAASLGAMGLYFLFLYPELGGVSQAWLAWLPVGWFVDLAAVGTPLVGSQTRTLVVLPASLAILAAGGVAVERTAVSLWFTDPVSVEESEGPAPETSGASRPDALAAAVAPLAIPRAVSVPVRRVGEWALLRTRRDPNRLTFLFLPVLAVGSAIISSGLQSGAIGALLAPIAAVVVPWLAGALFAMNPFGDEGAVLPVTLTAVSGRQFVRGLMVPGAVYGLPIAVVATGAATLASPYGLAERAGLVALAAYATCVSVAVAPAIGMALPRFSAISVGQSRDVLPPRMTAVIAHIAVTALPAGWLAALVVAPRIARAALAVVFGFLPAVVLGLASRSSDGALAAAGEQFREVAAQIQAIGLDQLWLVGAAVAVAGAVVAALLYANAVRRFDGYAPP